MDASFFIRHARRIRSSVMPSVDHSLKVFLCHARADRDPVRGLYARLTQDGVDRFAWLDKAKLLPGQDWELEIRKAVRLFLFSAFTQKF
jgi:hypothetical protein